MCDIVHWEKRTLTIEGRPQFLTCLHMEIFNYLIENADQYGDVWMDLSHQDVRVLNKLCKRDLLIRSIGPDGKRYKITGRGRKYFYYFRDTPAPRTDGLCPQCGERPRQRIGYCTPCSTEKRRQWAYANRYRTPKPRVKMCKDCNKAKAVRSSRCDPCFRANKLRLAKLRRDRHAENPPPCSHCGERPRKVYDTYLCPYCDPCRAKLRREQTLREKKARLNKSLRSKQ